MVGLCWVVGGLESRHMGQVASGMLRCGPQPCCGWHSRRAAASHGAYKWLANSDLHACIIQGPDLAEDEVQ